MCPGTDTCAERQVHSAHNTLKTPRNLTALYDSTVHVGAQGRRKMQLLEVTVENIRLKGVKKASRSMDACPGTESNPAPLSHEETH